MDTVIGKITQSDNDKIFEQAAGIIRDGGLVAFPTETVYGLGANALDSDAASKIYSAKGRPSDNPLIIHIADIKALDELTTGVDARAAALIESFWPGPMTLVFNKSDIVPYGVTGGLDTVAIRMPNHPVALRLIRESGCYIAAPSANTSGRPSPTRASHVIEDLSGRIDMIIEDDTVNVGIESTIIDVSGEDIYVLRPGCITLEMIRACVGNARLDPAITGQADSDARPKAPGMKYRHYAPKAQLTIVEGSSDKVAEYINQQIARLNEQGKKVGVMATDETVALYKDCMVTSLGSRRDEAGIASHLYECLRNFDGTQTDYIFAESFSYDNVGQAIMNRLIKAAGHNVISV